MKKVIKAIKNPKLVLLYSMKYKIFDLLSDEQFLKLEYYLSTNKKLDMENPTAFNEKLQWLKLYNQNPLYTKLVDKYGARKYVKDILGERHLNELYGVYEDFKDINFDELPEKFVLKATHTSGDYFICKNKSKIDFVELEKIVKQWKKRDYYKIHREWPYKNVEPRIIAERFLENPEDEELKDYRFFCFNGKPKFIAVDFSITDKSKTRRNLYDLNWNLLNEEISYPKELDVVLKKPKALDLMIDYSKRLSKDIPHVRVDFYYIKDQIYFGEMTFFHQSGTGNIRPEEFNEEMGSWITLPKKRTEKIQS